MYPSSKKIKNWPIHNLTTNAQLGTLACGLRDDLVQSIAGIENLLADKRL